MANNEKAWCWKAHDNSGEEPEFETFAARFQNVDAAKSFKESFEAAKEFNRKAKNGDEDLVWADTVEDIEEKVEDDIDTNKTAEEAWN